MSKPNRKCYTCGKEYYFCPSCGTDKNKPSWYAIFDCDVCRDVWNTIVTKYDQEGKEAARKELCKIDFDINTLKENVRNKVNMIMGTKDDIKNAVDEPSEEINEDIELNKPVVKKVTRNTNTKKKISTEIK